MNQNSYRINLIWLNEDEANVERELEYPLAGDRFISLITASRYLNTPLTNHQGCVVRIILNINHINNGCKIWQFQKLYIVN